MRIIENIILTPIVLIITLPIAVVFGILDIVRLPSEMIVDLWEKK